MRSNTTPVIMRTDIVSRWRSLVQTFAFGRPRSYLFVFILIMLLMIVVAGEVSKAFGVGFDSAASVQVDPRNISMSPISSCAIQVVIADNVRHLLALQLLDPFQLYLLTVCSARTACNLALISRWMEACGSQDAGTGDRKPVRCPV